jgi:hypothetical protein
MSDEIGIERECPVIHKVIRCRDGKVVGEIYAVWLSDGSGGFFDDGIPHGGILLRAHKFSGRVTVGALDHFKWNMTAAALAASDKYRFEPSPN